MKGHPNNLFYKSIVTIWLALSVASVFLAAVTWVQLSNRLAAAREAVAVQQDLDGVLRAMLDIETGQRGFTITGDAAFLEPMTAGQKSLAPLFEHLIGIARGDAEMIQRVTDLRAQIELSLDHQQRVVTARKTFGPQAAADLVASSEGRRIMDRIRAQITDLRGMRSDLLSEDGSVARSQLLRASLTSLVAGILGIGAGLFAFWLSRVMLSQQERERELVEAKLQAERTSREKTVFLANMSHEIRTPMNAILGFSELLAEDLRSPRHRQYLQSIRSSAASLLQLINDILDMSKIEAGVMELRLEPTDPREVCDFLHTVFSEPAAKKGVKLECKIAEDLPHALLLDRIRLRQVLVNLVGNAVKFTDQGSISVRLWCEKQKTSSRVTLLIEVQDTGVGIPADKLEAIFKPFVQAGAHREKEKQGTGLGLSIVKRLTEMMGGTVTAVSIPREGSAFSLRFPNVAISARLATGEKLEPDEVVDFDELRPATILVVDDNETNCRLIAGMFAGSAHRLVFGANGFDAVSQARELKPDVVLLDIRMHGMDGREALPEIRKIPGLEVTPVVAVTASSLLGDESDLKRRFTGYLRKPFSKRELFNELAHYLPRHENEPRGMTAAPEPAMEPVGPELLSELQHLLEKDWPALNDTLAVNETKNFATHLETLGLRWHSPPLLAYAQTLARHAENYAIVDMENHLHEFQNLVHKMREGGQGTST